MRNSGAAHWRGSAILRLESFQLSKFTSANRCRNALFVPLYERTPTQFRLDGALDIGEGVGRIAIAWECEGVLQEAQTSRIIDKPSGIKAMLVVMSDVPESVGKPVVEGLREDRFLPLGLDQAKELIPKRGFIVGR